MKKRHFSTVVIAGLVAASSLGSAFAQPGVNAKPAKTRTTKTRRTGGFTKRISKGIEEKLGKPLTADQTTRLTAAYQARQATVDVAQEKLLNDAAAITGLSVDVLRTIDRPNRKKAAQTPPVTAPINATAVAH